MVRFDWSEVNDPSQPVIYTLQIASNDGFDINSIVLEITELIESEYFFTEKEKSSFNAFCLRMCVTLMFLTSLEKGS